MALLLSKALVAQSQLPTRSLVRTLPLTHFYDTPQPLPHGNAGDLIRSEPFDDYDLPLSVSVVRILYHARSASGEDVVTSGVVLFPAEKRAPAGGWPVMAWAHSTTGVARSCAPSLRRNLGHGPFLSMYVDLGYAVVATDYTGLGTSFRNAFLDAPSNAADVIASVAAARKAVPQVGAKWVVIGAAEGGLTAVAVAEKEKDIHDRGYLGALVIADIASPTEIFYDSAQRSSSIRLASIAYGAKTVFPQFQPSEVLTGKGQVLYERVAQTCSDLNKIPELPPDEALKTGWKDNKQMRAYLDRSDPARTPANGPILVISSGGAAAPKSTPETISRMCKLGDRVQWEQYPDPDPGRVIGDSVRDQMAWIEARFAGRAAATTCR